MNKVIFIGIIAIILLLLDLYLFQAVKVVVSDSSLQTRRVVSWVFWGLAGITIAALFLYNFTNLKEQSDAFRQLVPFWIFAYFTSVLFADLFVVMDDLVRAVQWAWDKVVGSGTTVSENMQNLPVSDSVESSSGDKITRSDFLAKSAVIASVIPASTMGFGILSGAHDYKVHRHIIKLPNLPKAYHGLRIGQLSDIHSGSFFNKTAVKGGIEMLLAEKPDLIFFTGDLVNNVASEVKEYIDIFGKVTAPLGVYSTLGNHDYGDYVNWNSPQAKKQNLLDLIEAHRIMGWNILLNEHRILKESGEPLAIIGVENIGGTGGTLSKRYEQYGDMAKAYAGTEEIPVKLLLSHNPTHWDMEVRSKYKDVDVTFSGHTHGFQFGLELGSIKWSPAQYFYRQWAGLYKEDNQYLYVNRGFGYLGYPGRIGILPEITIIELERA